MKIKIEFDLTPEEAKEFFVPSDKQAEFNKLLYDAYVNAVQETVLKHVDPYNYMGFQKDK